MLDKSVTLDCSEDSTATAITLEYRMTLTAVCFMRLTLRRGSKVRSSNFHLRGREQGNLRAIRTLGNTTVVAKTTAERRGATWVLRTELENTWATPALFVRVQAERATTGDRIVPAIFEDNYFALMPRETRVIKTEVAESDTRGETPRVSVKGFKVVSGEHAAL